MEVFPILVVVLVALAIAFALLIRRLVAPTVTECSPEWLNTFSMTKYQPMLRLLERQDFAYLEAQAGYSARQLRKLRTERRRIFRAYLRNLIGDFHRLHLSARMLVINAETDRPELASKLLTMKLTFTYAVLIIEFRLMLHSLGLGTVEVRNLLRAVENLRIDVGSLVPVPQPSAS